MNKRNLLFTLALSLLLCQNLQAQTSLRLVGESHYLSNGVIFVPVDSSYFSYSNGRGGNLADSMLKYDNGAKKLYNAFDTLYVNDSNYIQTFDSANYLLTDIKQYWDGAMYVNASNTLYFYDSLKRLNQKIYQTWDSSAFINVAEHIYSYNTASQLYTDQYQAWDSTAFIPVNQKTFYYDASGNKLQEIEQVYNTASATYAYSSSLSYIYSGTGLLVTTADSTWNGSSFSPVFRYTYTYDSIGNQLNSLYQVYDTASHTWINKTLNSYSHFIHKMPQTEVYQVWDTAGSGYYNNITKYTYTYNTDDLLTSSIGESFNIGGYYQYAYGDPLTKYYYQAYTPAVSAVQGTLSLGAVVNVYPVPAHNILHIGLNWNHPQAATITIYDMEGKIVSSWETAVTKQSNTTLMVNSFPAGNYLVKINGTQEQILKQIVVVH